MLNQEVVNLITQFFYGLQIFLKNIPWGYCITTEDVSEAQDYLGNEKVFWS
jgi:hypothetical protein